jgi:hypothetical protein
MNICPTCGQPIAPTGLPLSPIKARILALVQRRPGIDAQTLRELIWANDPNGGPENAKAIHVHVNQLNRILASQGIRIRGSHGGGYRLQKLPT